MNIKLSDLIRVQRSQSAIELTSGLGERDLIATFMPTDAAISILRKIERAVQPDANVQDRALNWFGTYGAGKSRLAVLVGQMLRDGVAGAEFDQFLGRLTNVGEDRLASALKSTFLPPNDDDAQPYFVVPIYGNQAGTIQDALVESLYRAIADSKLFSPEDILPNTTFDVAVQRLDAMLEGRPALADDYLPGLGFDSQYSNTSELKTGLQQRESGALVIFSEWHVHVTLGTRFSPELFGASSVIDIYLDAAQALRKKKYRGIAVIWDELGFAIEDMLQNSMRKAQSEIFELQQFVERVCAPSLGHTLFIGLTHVGLAEYGPRQRVADGLKQRLETIEGRFTAMKVELRAVESEGYHLLAAQVSHTPQLVDLLASSKARSSKIIDNCKPLILFSHLSEQIEFIVENCYPLHPITAAALLALSNEYAAATRTAFTFLPALEEANRFEVNVHYDAMFGSELVRVVELVDYYSDRMRVAGMGDQLDTYRANIAQTSSDGADADTIAERNKVMAVVLLSSVLGIGFQASDQFLAAALHDAGIADLESAALRAALSWLSDAGLLWKNDTTGLWKAGGDGSTNVEKLIEDAVTKIPNNTIAEYFAQYSALANDVLPMLGQHQLDPSPQGIVRSYVVEAMSAEKALSAKPHATAAAKAVIVLHDSSEQIKDLEASLIERPVANMFYWVSVAEPDGVHLRIQRYLGITSLLSQSHNEGTRMRLLAKFEGVRTELLTEFGFLYGREGIRRSTTKIIHQGHSTGVAVESWSAFRASMQSILDQVYHKELAVRAPQKKRNVHGDSASSNARETLDIVERILEFATNVAYQNNLLGFPEGGEPGAVVDGVLGANNLFIERPHGCDLKRPEEVQGAVKAVVDLVREKLLRRREKPYQLIELAKELSAEPFGLPVGAIPIFIAFALQKDVEKLVWPAGGSAAKNICEGMTDSRIGARFGDFTTNQLNVLGVLRNALDKINGEANEWDRNPHDAGRQAVDALRAFVKAIPTDIVKSPKLDKRLRELSETVKIVAITPHEIVEKLATLIDSAKQLQGTNPAYEVLATSRTLLVDILSDARRVEDETRFEIIKFVKSVIPGGDSQSEWNDFLSRLRQVSELGADAATILALRPLSDTACIRMIERAANKVPIDELSALQVGFAVREIQELMDSVEELVVTGLEVDSVSPIPKDSLADAGMVAKNFNDLTSTIDDAVRMGEWKLAVKTLVNQVILDAYVPRTEIAAFLNQLIGQLQAESGNGES
jgi:hypothetical protein